MKRRPLIAAFAAPIAITVLLAPLAAAIGFFGFILIGFVVLAAGAIGLIGAVVSAIFMLDSVSSRFGGRRPRTLLAVSCGTVAACLLFLPLSMVADEGARVVKRPVREMLAERVIERNRHADASGHHDIELEGYKKLLSDSGVVTVYRDSDVLAVWFWDVRGILDSYSASIYVSDSTGTRVPASLREMYRVEHESGHWWRAVPD